MNHVHGAIPITAHLVLRPGEAGLVTVLVQSPDVARVLAAEPGARAYRLDCTLLDLLQLPEGRLTQLQPEA